MSWRRERDRAELLDTQLAKFGEKVKQETPAEQRHYGMARAALDKRGASSRLLLEFLRRQERISVRGDFVSPFPPRLAREETKTLLSQLTQDEVVRCRHDPMKDPTLELYEIVPAMLPALDELL